MQKSSFSRLVRSWLSAAEIRVSVWNARATCGASGNDHVGAGPKSLSGRSLKYLPFSYLVSTLFPSYLLSIFFGLPQCWENVVLHIGRLIYHLIKSINWAVPSVVVVVVVVVVIVVVVTKMIEFAWKADLFWWQQRPGSSVASVGGWPCFDLEPVDGIRSPEPRPEDPQQLAAGRRSAYLNPRHL